MTGQPRATPDVPLLVAARRRPTLATWLLWVTLGEVLGFGVPAASGALLADAEPGWLLVAMVAAGTVEGTVLGLAQAQVLAAAAGIRRRSWVLATAAGAAVAWTAGMLPPTFASVWRDWRPASAVAAAVLLGIVLLSTIGTAQWLVLRRHVDRVGGWVWVTALAWCAGLSVFAAVTTPLWQPRQGEALVLGIGLLGGVLMAGTMALVTGLWLRRRHLV